MISGIQNRENSITLFASCDCVVPISITLAGSCGHSCGIIIMAKITMASSSIAWSVKFV